MKRSPATIKPIEAVFVCEIHFHLSEVQSRDSLQSIDEGEQYICANCDLQVKICAGNPRALCMRKVRGQTQLQILE